MLLSVLLMPLPFLALSTPTLVMELWAQLETPFSLTTRPGLKAVTWFLIFSSYSSPGSTILTALKPPSSIFGEMVVLRVKVAPSALAKGLPPGQGARWILSQGGAVW